jgi:hypothetical protein
MYFRGSSREWQITLGLPSVQTQHIVKLPCCPFLGNLPFYDSSPFRIFPVGCNIQRAAARTTETSIGRVGSTSFHTNSCFSSLSHDLRMKPHNPITVVECLSRSFQSLAVFHPASLTSTKGLLQTPLLPFCFLPPRRLQGAAGTAESCGLLASS